MRLRWRRSALLALVPIVFADPAAAAVPSAPGPSVVVVGSGWGHSVGMSQYGARAMAQQGRSSREILQHYYPGTTVGPDGRVADDRPVSVDLFLRRGGLEGSTRVDLRAIGANSPTADPTSGVAIDMNDGTVRHLPATTAGWWVSHDVNGGQFVLHEGDREVARGTNTRPVRVYEDAPGGSNPGILKVLNLASADSAYVGTFRTGGSRGGALEIRANGGGGALSPVLVQPMRTYLYGIAEVPGSWEAAVLEAQAITARTYAGRVGGVISATPAHQAYGGFSKELVGGSAWPRAVDATSTVAVSYSGELAQTYYSSSHGLGRSENSEDSWAYGATIPYLRSVPDPFSGAPGTGNPYVSWTAVATNTSFAATVGLAKVNRIRVLSRTAGGSPKAVEVDGWTSAGVRTTCTWTGGQPCSANDTAAKGAGAKLRTTLQLAEGGAGGRLRSQQISELRIAPFVDDEASLHQFNIGAVAAAGIAQGCASDRYCPGSVVTRGQMASFLSRAIALPPDSGPDAFTDIARSPHRAAINALARAGKVSGNGDGTYRPDAPVTREQMATFLARSFDVPPSDRDRFTDTTDSVHRRNINGVADRGFTGGCTTTTYCPKDQVTREQMASFLARAKGLGE